MIFSTKRRREERARAIAKRCGVPYEMVKDVDIFVGSPVRSDYPKEMSLEEIEKLEKQKEKKEQRARQEFSTHMKELTERARLTGLL